MTMRQESESNYLVNCEVSAAIGFEVRCAAIDVEAAEGHVNSVLEELQPFFEAIVRDLLQGPESAVAAYMESFRLNKNEPPLEIASAKVCYSKDDSLEVVDVREED